MTSRFRRPVGLVPLIMAAAALAATQAPPPPSAVLAKVGNATITVEAFEQEMARRGGSRPGAYATAEQRQALLEQMVAERSLLAAARAAGYERDPEVVTVTERMMVSRLRQDRLDPRLASAQVSDEEVAAFYREHQADYAVPERVQAAMVFLAVHPVASDEKRAEIERRAEAALAEARALDSSVRHFGPVARAYSDDRASRYQGGVIGWLVRHPGQTYRWEPEVVEAIFALTGPGEIGPLVHTAKGVYLVRLVDREAASARPLEQVADGIRHRLQRDRREQLERAFLAEVTATVPVEVHAELLEGLAPTTPASEGDSRNQPPPLPAD